MDPNANLREQAELLAHLRTGAAMAESRDARRSNRSRLAELRSALTDWLHGGGFAPDWSRYPAAARYFGISVPFGGTVGADYRYKATR